MYWKKLNIVMLVIIIFITLISTVSAMDADANSVSANLDGVDHQLAVDGVNASLEIYDVHSVNNPSITPTEVHNTTIDKSVSNAKNSTYSINISLYNNTTSKNISVKDARDNFVFGNITFIDNTDVEDNSFFSVLSQTRNYTANFNSILPSLEKTAFATNVSIGDYVVYLINVTLPVGKYSNLTISDRLPDGFNYVNATIDNHIVTPTTNDGSIVTFTFIDIDSMALSKTCVI